MKIGRNDRCPCGSGLKYKKCCLDAAAVRPMVSRRQPLAVQAQPGLGKAQPAVVGQVREVVKQVIDERQQQESAPVQDVASVVWNSCPAVKVLQSLAEQETVKATATGNFSRDFCQQQVSHLCVEQQQGKAVRGEGDLPLLGLFKRAALASNMIAFEKGRYSVTEQGHSLLKDSQQEIVQGMMQVALEQEQSLDSTVWATISSKLADAQASLTIDQLKLAVPDSPKQVEACLASFGPLFGLLTVDQDQVTASPLLSAVAAL